MCGHCRRDNVNQAFISVSAEISASWHHQRCFLYAVTMMTLDCCTLHHPKHASEWCDTQSDSFVSDRRGRRKKRERTHGPHSNTPVRQRLRTKILPIKTKGIAHLHITHFVILYSLSLSQNHRTFFSSEELNSIAGSFCPCNYNKLGMRLSSFKKRAKAP